MFGMKSSFPQPACSVSKALKPDNELHPTVFWQSILKGVRHGQSTASEDHLANVEAVTIPSTAGRQDRDRLLRDFIKKAERASDGEVVLVVVIT
jgi:hypothetical protein